MDFYQIKNNNLKHFNIFIIFLLSLFFSSCSHANISTNYSKDISKAKMLPKMEYHSISTQDGWELSMLHIPPKYDKSYSPVILCHGTASNISNMDYFERSSLGRYLSAIGFDVWIPELRGGPLGKRKDKNGKIHKGRFKSMRERGVDWDFDSHVIKDVPAIVSRVKVLTGADNVHWVGHSLGGILGWASEARGVVAGFKSIVGIGSPGNYENVYPLANKLSKLGWVLPILHGIPAKTFMPILSNLMPLAPKKSLMYMMNPYNMDKDELKILASETIEDSPPGLLKQYISWIKYSEIKSADGVFNYTQAISRVRSPIALLSGRADGIAPAWTVKFIYDTVESTQKNYKTFGITEGDHIDYGHFDLVLGIYAPVDVFPWIAKWLTRQEISS